jgi:hypothetical protein
MNYYLGKTSIIHFKGESTLKDAVYFERFFTSVKYYFQKHYTNSKWIVSLLSLFFHIAKWTKKSNIHKNERHAKDFNRIFCLTENQELVEKISKHFNKDVHILDKETALEFKFNKDYIVFDKDYVLVGDIIHLMKTHAETENYFRIKPSFSNLIIGSDSSTSQGEVIMF